MDNSKPATLSLCVEEHVLARILPILQKGFILWSRAGYSINEFLCMQQKISSDYITERVSTIFLDGKPVDDIDMTVIQDGSTIALSGAMPGLVGAVMRRGSFYASFRDSITYKKGPDILAKEKCMVNLKLFNIVMKELGLDFLKKGVFFKSSDLTDFLLNQSKDFWQGCKEILLNKKPVEHSLIEKGEFVLQNDLVFFSVKTTTL
jgi:hypothetical protein